MKNYKQTDIRWCNVPYAGSVIGRAGCGPTACADIIEKSPKTIAAWLQKKGYAVNGQGTSWAGIKKVLEAYGFECSMLNSSNAYGKKDTEAEAKFKKKLQSGKYYGILLMGKSMFTSGGHYITISKWDKKKGYYVLDPYSKRLNGWHKWSDFDGRVKIFYVIKKPEKKVTEPQDKQKAAVTYYPKPKKTDTLHNALTSINVDAGFDNRAKIAKKNGMADYKGTYDENIQLLNLLCKGKLKQ